MLLASTVLGATVGALVMGLFSSRSYDRGYDDGANMRLLSPTVPVESRE